ncbi:MAG: flagellin [Eubacteriales bacterium]
MRIQNNIPGKNSYNALTKNQKALSSNLEKLSSGYSINTAADNAAGLAISEKMRAHITGLDIAQDNVSDGINLVKVGEGAMQELSDMVNRMKELAVRSANGMFDDEVARASMQLEVDELLGEINRVADSTHMNGMYLLDGSTGTEGSMPYFTELEFDMDDAFMEALGNALEGFSEEDLEILSDVLYYGTSGLTLQIGDTGDDFNQLEVPIFDMHAERLGIEPFDVSTQKEALNSIDKVETALNRVSNCRAVYGAIQNRLDSTFKNLGVMEENIQDAESTIRDTDFAKETMEYAKNNILAESNQTMLAHANTMPETVLQLLG